MSQEEISSFQRIREAHAQALHLYIRLAHRDEPSETHVCLVMDQFKDVFTLCQDRAERDHFIDLLRYAATIAAGQTVVVLTMRADFLVRAAAYAPLGNILSAHPFLVTPMAKDELRSAIEAPARLLGVPYATGLVDAILQDIGQEPGPCRSWNMR